MVLFIEIAAGEDCLKTRQTAKFKEYSALLGQNDAKSNFSKPFRVVVLFRIEHSGDLTLQTVHFQ